MKKQNKQRIERNLNVTNGGAFKRVGALFIDVLLFVGLMYLLNLAIRPIINSAFEFDTLSTEMTREVKRSYLVELKEEISEDESNIDTVEVVKDPAPITMRGEATYKFYTIYLRSKESDDSVLYTKEWYIENILKVNEIDSLFVLDPGFEPQLSSMPTSGSDTSEEVVEFDDFVVPGYKFKESVKPEDINTFNNEIFVGARQIFLNQPLAKKVMMVTDIQTVSAIVLSSSIVFLALPLFLKDGQSLGKFIFKLGVVTKYGYKVNSISLLVRYLSFLLLNLLSNMLIPVLFPFISLTIMVFNRHGYTLHDLIAFTQVVDLTKSKIYENEEAYKKDSALSVGETDANYNEEVFSDRFDEGSRA